MNEEERKETLEDVYVIDGHILRKSNINRAEFNNLMLEVIYHEEEIPTLEYLVDYHEHEFRITDVLYDNWCEENKEIINQYK